MTSEPQAVPPASIFRLPGFRTIWIAQFISIFGDFLALFGIISFIAFRLHGTRVDSGREAPVILSREDDEGSQNATTLPF